jgi:lipopolysaccharide transport system permease protein
MAFQIADASLGFFNFTAIIKQVKIPFLVFTLRLASRQLIILMHNLIIIVLVLLLVGKGFNWISLIAIPSFIIVQMNLIFLSLVIAIFCTRYQDMSQVVIILVQLIFFFTPILWNADTIQTKKFIFELNPIYHWIEIIRAPLIGNIPSVNNYFWSGFTLIILSLLATYCVGRYQGRIAYWL